MGTALGGFTGGVVCTRQDGEQDDSEAGAGDGDGAGAGAGHRRGGDGG